MLVVFIHFCEIVSLKLAINTIFFVDNTLLTSETVVPIPALTTKYRYSPNLNFDKKIM